MPGTERYRKPRLFVATLRYSRRSFRCVVWKSSQKVWAELHEQAWRYFGGSCRYVVLDNLKEGVLKPELYEPELNPVYAAMLAHYEVVADPARVRDPNLVNSKWDDEDDGRMPAPPEQSVDLLADDWSNVSAWYALREHAELQPCRFVTQGTYREADATLLTASLLARNALLTGVASSAISGMGHSSLLEARGFWPCADKPNGGVSSYLWKMAEDCLALINSFVVEDEESLQCLCRACERELRKVNTDDAVVDAARERVQRGLWNARDDVLSALNAATRMT